MTTEDIERLKEKLEKDPSSKLFVPLAEEYKKAGMFDEAVDVLTKGLERQPSYLSARVSLGKLYGERGMLDEASAEFEKVIAVIPDNLYAHKKLAEIYKDLGRKDDAIREFNTVLRLNPADEWAATTLSTIEQASTFPAGERPEKELEEKFIPETKAFEIFPPEEPSETGRGTLFDEALTARDLEISKNLSQETKEELEQEEEPLEIPLGGEEAELWGAPEAAEEEIKEELEQEEEPFEIPLSGEETELVGAPDATEGVKEEQEIPPKTAISREDMELWKSHLDAVEGAPIKGEVEVNPAVEAELPEEGPISFEEILKEPEVVHEILVEEDAIPVPPAEGRETEDADAYIGEGKYGEAMRVYRIILSRSPGDKHVLQRVEELRSLLKLLGKDKDELIDKLDHLLESIKKRRDEFSGSS